MKNAKPFIGTSPIYTLKSCRYFLDLINDILLNNGAAVLNQASSGGGALMLKENKIPEAITNGARRKQKKTQIAYSETPLQRLQPRLNRWRQTGVDQYMASCPGPLHKRGDRNPSLSIRETDDNTLLVHCYAGCSAAEIVQGAGLELRDLFPNNGSEYRAPIPKSQRWDYKGLLKQLRFEATLVIVAANAVRDGTLTDDDRTRLDTAAIRIARIVEVVS